MKTALLILSLALPACGGRATTNACATPSAVVTCDEQNFYTFDLASDDAGHPTWIGNQCREVACSRGASCEVEIGGSFAQGVCE